MSLRSRIRTSSLSPASAGASPAESTATLARRLAANGEGQAGEVPRLVIEGGPCDGGVLGLEKQGHAYRIGRSSGCHMVIADDDMSREHAEIERRWDGVFVRDLGSKNGVLLRGQRLTGERRLADGDVVEMGQTRFLLDDPTDRHLRRVQDGTAIPSPKEPADTRTATRVSLPGEAPERHSSRVVGRVRPLTLLVIAAVILVATIGLALSFLLAR